METYWGVLKDGSLRVFEKAPKRKYVVDSRVPGNMEGISHHTLTCGEKIRDFTSHCGYDRGPKLHRILKSMLAV